MQRGTGDQMRTIAAPPVSEKIRADLAALDPRDPTFSLVLSLHQIEDLAAGFCPALVTAMARLALDTEDAMHRQARARAASDELRRRRREQRTR